jgi:glutamyl-tRNA reductase
MGSGQGSSHRTPYRTSTLQLVVVGLNQSTAPLPVRERVAFVGSRSGDALAHLASEVEEGFILSTCNRTEVYALAGHAESGIRLVTGWLERWHGIDPGTLAPYLYAHTHEAAVRHLFRVISGLDSMVLGEDQIVGQARSALALATAAGSLGPRVHRLGAAALAVSKRVRAETRLCRSPVSVVSIALGAAADDLGGLAGRSVVVVGAGRTAESVLKLLRSLEPSATVTVVNRTAAHAARLGARHGARTAEWSELARHVASADLVISATSAPCVVVGASELRAAAARGRPLVCLDLAVPRDIDPAAAVLPGISIHHIDDLQQRATANRVRREAEIGPAEAIVEQGVARFAEWWRAREVVPVISRLRARADAMREAEVQRALARLPHVDAASEAVVRALAARLVNRLLHEPLTNVKEGPEGANLAIALDRLFAPRAARSDPPATRSAHSIESIAS